MRIVSSSTARRKGDTPSQSMAWQRSARRPSTRARSRWGRARTVGAGFLQQGGFRVVRLLSPPPGLSEATVQFAGGSYSMLSEGDRWFAVIGLGPGFAPGDYSVEVEGVGG